VKGGASLAMMIGADSTFTFPFDEHKLGVWCRSLANGRRWQEAQYQSKDSKLHCVRSLCTEVGLGLSRTRGKGVTLNNAVLCVTALFAAAGSLADILAYLAHKS
jgi:hypothetical protein